MSNDPPKPKCPGCDSDLSPGTFTCAKCGHTTMWPFMGYATLVALLMVAPLLSFPAHGFLRIFEWVLAVPGFMILFVAVFSSCEFLHARARLSCDRRNAKRKPSYDVVAVPIREILTHESSWGSSESTSRYNITFPNVCVRCCKASSGTAETTLKDTRHGYKNVQNFTLRIQIPFCDQHLAEYEAAMIKTKRVRGFAAELYAEATIFIFRNREYGRLLCDQNPHAKALTSWDRLWGWQF